MMKTKAMVASLCGLVLLSCKQQETSHDHGHSHAHGEESSGKEEDHGHDDHDHDHGEEVSLGTFEIGGMKVEAAQAHGKIEAGKEGHLIVKLSEDDGGETTVRAWIGVEDRTLSQVGKGVYAASHADYDIHMVAPEPLPEGTAWWVEIEKPNGEQLVGSFPVLE